MLFRGIIDATLGRVYLPLRTAVSTAVGELWMNGLSIYVRGNDISQTLLRLLTDNDLGKPGGVCPLGGDGLVPSTYLPTQGGGSTASGLIGEIKMWGGDPFQLPAGWLVCDGSEVSKVAYPALFAVFGHRYGVPSDYATKFKLPDCIGRGPIGSAGSNDAAQGRVHKITIRNPGTGFTNGTHLVTLAITGAGGSAMTVAATANVVVDGGAVVRVDIVTGGTVTGLSAIPTAVGAGSSNCPLYLPQSFGVGFQFEYDVVLAPTASSSQGWNIRLTNGGSAYTSAPAVLFNAGCDATAVAVLEGDRVREIIVTNLGTVVPSSVSFSGGGGIDAAGGIVYHTAQATAGDVGGEQAHAQTLAEVASHDHVYRRGLFGSNETYFPNDENGRGTPSSVVTFKTLTSGSNAPASVRGPYFGTLFICFTGIV